MITSDLSVGCKVRLNSGGPIMIVEYTFEDDGVPMAHVRWTFYGRTSRAVFPIACLAKIKVI